MNEKRDDRQEAYGPFVRFAVISLLLLMATAGFKSYRDLAEARAHETELHGKIEATRQRVEQLEDQVERIEGDSLTLERLAREELGWVRDGDLVIVLPEDTPNPSASHNSVP
ncbi:MAG: septum formation initiator family protein [Acidobacteriota bacterium]